MTNSLDDMFGSLLADCEKQGILKSVPSYRGDGKKEKPRVIFVESVKIFNPKSLVLLSNEVTCDCCGAVDVHSNTYILKESVNAKGDRLLDMHIQPSVINLPRKIEVVKSTTSMCYLCFIDPENPIKPVESYIQPEMELSAKQKEKRIEEVETLLSNMSSTFTTKGES